MGMLVWCFVCSCCVFRVCDNASGFFFFKQKTAYEMRISDWSSDVCSSDLHSGGGCQGSGRPILLLELRKDAAAKGGWAGSLTRPTHFEAGSNFMEIGRASCGERGCQYV